MDNQPIRDERILHAIEACRPGSDDVADPALEFLAAELDADPQLAELYDRLQQLDSKLAAAFREVPVPEGLEQRLLDRLATAEAASPVSPRPKRVSRRWLLAGSAAVTVAAAVLVAVGIGIPGPDDDGEQAVLDEGIRFFNKESAELGVLLADKAPPSGYPISRAVLRLPEIRWRRIEGFAGRNGVAYDLSRGGVRATLHVVKPQVAGLPTRAPASPMRSTGQRSASAWNEGGVLYVLVVHGDARTYRGFLAPRGPLA